MLLMVAGCGAKKNRAVNNYLATSVSGYNGTGSVALRISRIIE